MAQGTTAHLHFEIRRPPGRHARRRGAVARAVLHAHPRLRAPPQCHRNRGPIAPGVDPAVSPTSTMGRRAEKADTKFHIADPDNLRYVATEMVVSP